MSVIARFGAFVQAEPRDAAGLLRTRPAGRFFTEASADNRQSTMLVSVSGSGEELSGHCNKDCSEAAMATMMGATHAAMSGTGYAFPVALMANKSLPSAFTMLVGKP